jgi:hypothetical protein
MVPAGEQVLTSAEVKVQRYTHGRSTNYKVLGLVQQLVVQLRKAPELLLSEYEVLQGRRLIVRLEAP